MAAKYLDVQVDAGCRVRAVPVYIHSLALAQERWGDSER